jgi:hypothetical protein
MQAQKEEELAEAERRAQEDAAAALAALSIHSNVSPSAPSSLPSTNLPGIPSRDLKPPSANAVPVLYVYAMLTNSSL